MDQSWINGLAGGLMIGLSAALYLLFNGRIAGMSGMIAQATRIGRDTGAGLGLGFLAGALAGAAGFVALAGAPQITVTHSVGALVASGLIVGIGVRRANGCTSGHGVCGMSRLSLRSIAATLTFMAATAATVAALRHGLGVAP